MTARLSDRFQNPVPDGTAVSFHTECGQIQPSCSTINGSCSVTFTTENPRTRTLAATGTPTFNENQCSTSDLNLGCDDHRCTVTATAIGEESFNDCNGTGTFISVGNPANNGNQCSSGDFFVALPEAFYDYNENGTLNADFEEFIDFNSNGKWDNPVSTDFVGLLCNGDPLCDTNQSSLTVSDSIVIVMSSSTLQLVVNTFPPGSSFLNKHDYFGPPAGAIPTICLGASQAVYVSIGDTAWQQIPDDSTVSASMGNGGSIIAPSSISTVFDNNFGFDTFPFVIKAPTSSTSDTDLLTITVTAPNLKVPASASFPVTYKSC